MSGIFVGQRRATARSMRTRSGSLGVDAGDDPLMLRTVESRSTQQHSAPLTCSYPVELRGLEPLTPYTASVKTPVLQG